MQTYFRKIEEAMTHVPYLDGRVAHVVHLTNRNGMSASFMDVGATWLSCTLPMNGTHREVLLRSTNMDEHIKQTAYFGAIVGRFANRIDAGRFAIGDERFQIPMNDGNNALHGGEYGFDKRRWTIESQTENRVRLTLVSQAGDQGFPGNLSVSVTYTLTDENELQIHYLGSVDADSPVNLTNHAYFNLAGEGAEKNSRDHRLSIQASHYLPTREDLIPTGEIKAVSGTSFDFTTPKLIDDAFLADDDQKIAGGYDHAFIFDPSVVGGEQVAAKLIAPNKDVVMAMKTTKPAIQFYSGNFLQGTPGYSKTYQIFDGLALETQFFPDGANHSEWGKNRGVLKVNETYDHQTSYRFFFESPIVE